MTKKVLITGGAGFIGSNVAKRCLDQGESVTVLDDLSRPSAPLNLAWLRTQAGGELDFVQADVTDQGAVDAAIAGADVVYHLAAQTAVTISVQDPVLDFETNLRGSLVVLEAARRLAPDAALIFSSTNKVYGDLESAALREEETRYVYADGRSGIDESEALSFHSPYGCSKGGADMYFQDYHRIYGLNTVVFRQSCIYGPRQFGVEDQGWVAWFAIKGLLDGRLNVYGDGKQVRDLLHVDDLMDAYDLAIEHLAVAGGKAYNIGGGAENSLSIWREFGPLLERAMGRTMDITFRDWRPGDQKVFISDNRRVMADLGWRPAVPVEDGIRALVDWLQQHRELVETLNA